MKKKKARKLKAQSPLTRETDKTFLIAIISIVAVVVLFLILLFADQLVGKAIAVNSAGAELVSPAYSNQPFSLKVSAYPQTEITSVQFTLKLPNEMDCSFVSGAPVTNLLEGWNVVENKCSGGKISFYSTKGASLPTGESGLTVVAQVGFIKNLSAGPYVFSFDSFLALKGGMNKITTSPSPLAVTVQEPPATPVCGNSLTESGEQCDDGNTVTEACPDYGQSCNVCDASCQSITVKGPFCGDKKKNGNEQCDGTGDCDSQCKVVLTATCGDNICDVKQESTASCPSDCGEVCPTNNLISWWKGENNAQDNSISGYHGTVQNVAYESGVVGKAFKFSGVNSFIDLGDKTGTLLADPTGQSLSVNFWMKTNALTNGQGGALYIIDSGAATDGKRGFYCNTQGGDLNCAIRQQSNLYQVSTKKAIPLNSWKLVTLTFDESKKELKLYLDGAFSKSGTETKLSTETYASDKAVIGATNKNLLLFNGLLDEISIWNRALTAAEVDSLFGAGTTGMCAKPTSICGNNAVEAGEECDDGNNLDGDNCSSICLKESAICGDNVCEIKFESTTSCKQDCGLVCPTNGLVSWWRGENDQDSFGSHHGTLGGDAAPVPGKVDNALYFDGEGDYFTLGQKPGTIFSDPTGQSLSLSFWIKTNASEGPASTALYILDSGAGAASRRGFYCNTQKAKLYCVLKHAEKIYDVTAETVLPLSQWKFVTLTFDQSKEELKLYVDGNFVAAGTKATLSSAYQPVPASIIGATSLQTLPFKGTLDELAVWDRVLTSAEVKAIFDTGNIGMCAVPEAVCGNGFVETGEECDDSNLIDTDACTSLCKNAVCGDGIIRSGVEQCDGSSLAGASCSSLGFANGTLSCGASCLFNSTACVAAPPPAPIPPATSLTINGTKITLGEVAPANDTFSTLLTATEGFTSKIMVYTVLYNADGKVLKLETDDVTGLNKDAWVVVTATHPLAEVKKKVVLIYDQETNPTIYGKLEKSYS